MAAIKSLFGLSLFALSVSAAGSIIPEGWSVLDACAVDVPGRLFKSVKVSNLPNNTPLDCVSLCDSQGYTHAGVEYGKECHCGRGYEFAKASSAPASECNMPCEGDASQKCGAGWRVQVYVSNSKLPSSPSLPSTWSTAYGCAINSGDRVLLDNQMNVLPKKNSPAACVKLCDSRGFTHAGVEYGSECHCGRGYAWEPVSAPIDECDMDCTGNSFYNCGSGRRITIYTLDSPSPSGTTTATMSPSTSTAVPVASSIAVSGNIGVYNKDSDKLIGYITPTAGGKAFKVVSDQSQALNVQFKFSSVPNTPFSIRISDDSPYGYLGSIQGSNYMKQCRSCGEWYDELTSVNYNKFGVATHVGNGYDDLMGGSRLSQATMWMYNDRTNVIEGTWFDSGLVGQQLNMYTNTPTQGTYMNADKGAWSSSAHPRQGDVQVVYKFEGDVPKYTPTCQGVTGFTHKSAGGDNFDIHCVKDFPGNDIAFTYPGSFDKCLDNCSAFNVGRSSGKCVGVTFVRDNGACCLKGFIDENVWYLPPLTLASAVLKV